jgi:beta-lactamase regulating signal transducer with metallopeptidase domain
MTGVKACFILLLTGLAAQLLRRSSAAKRHLLWVAGIGAAVILPLITLSVPNWSVPLRYSVATAPLAEIQVAVGSAASLGAVQEPGAQTRRNVTPVGRIPAASAPRVANGATLGNARFDLGWPAALFAIWMLGAVIALWPWLLGVIGRSDLMQQASDLLPAPWERSLHELQAEGFVPKRVQVLTAADCSTPMTWGVIRPVVLVPTHTTWCENERRNALLHEFAHVRRADYLCKLASRILCSIYWFNPLAWLAARAERLSREQACDDAVLRSGSRASAYAQQLLDVASGAGRYTIAAAALTMARPSNLARRLRAILDAAPDRSPTGRGLSSIAVGAVCVIVPPLAALSPEWIRESSVTPPQVSAPRLQGEQSRSAPPPIPSSVRAVFDTAMQTLTDSSAMTLTRATDRMANLASGIATLSPATVQLDQQAVDCVPSGKRSSGSIHNDDGRGPEGRRWQVRWTDGTCRIELDARGTFTLSPNGDDITAITARGYVDLEEDDGRTERRVRMQRGDDGGIERTYWVNGTRATWDADAAAWFSRVLVMLDRRTAFAVDTRLPMLLQRGGVEAVLAEVSQMPSSYAQRVYYTKLFQRQSLSTEQLVRVLETATSTFDSGYEKAELLLSVAKQPNFAAPVHLAFAQMARSIESDYEKRRALSALLARSDLKPDVVRTMLEATEGMKSDYELAELLLAIDRRYAVDETTRPFYIRALSTIESDYEQRRVLTAIMRAGEISPAASGEMISIAGRTMKGYELAEFLAQISAKGTMDQATSTAFFNATKNVESAYERRRVLQALLQKGELTKPIIEGILGTAATIENDFECAELLVSVARTGKVDDTLRPSYEKAAATIGSDYEYGRAMSAVRRSAQRS